MRSGRSFMLRSFLLRMTKKIADVKIDEAAGKRIWKASKIRYVVRNEQHRFVFHRVSRYKVYLRLRLARTCVHLRWLAMTCAHFGRDQICTQVKASFSPFGHPTQVNASWVTFINLLLANEIQDISAWKWVFCDSRVLARKLASAFGHPTQDSTQVQLALTCDYLPVRLTSAYYKH